MLVFAVFMLFTTGYTFFGRNDELCSQPRFLLTKFSWLARFIKQYVCSITYVSDSVTTCISEYFGPHPRPRWFVFSVFP